MKTPPDKTIPMVLTVLGVGLLLLGILALQSDATRTDSAVAQEISGVQTWLYLMVTGGCLLLFAALSPWRVVPLLMARPTVTVDCLPQANAAGKPANYDPSRNAAPHYERLFSQFVPLPEALKDKYRSWPANLSPEEFWVLEEWVPANDAALAALAQAARCPYWWHELTSTDGSMAGIAGPDLEPIRNCGRGVLLLAKYEASRGDTRRAFELLKDLHMFAMHQVQGATLVAQMVGAGLCELSYGGLLAVLDHCRVEIETLNSTRAALAARIPEIIVPHFSDVEHLYGLDYFQRLFTDDGQGNGRLIPGALYRSRKNRPNPYSPRISYPEAVFICLAHPDRRSTLRSYESSFALLRELVHQTPWTLHAQNTSYEKQLHPACFGNYCLHDSLLATAQCIRIGWRTRVSGDATVATLALFAYQTQEGRLPESLNQLVDHGLLPSVPLDPYSGAPLVYKVNGSDFTLYSVGEDLVDDGGRPCEWNDKRGGDHVFWPVPDRA